MVYILRGQTSMDGYTFKLKIVILFKLFFNLLKMKYYYFPSTYTNYRGSGYGKTCSNSGYLVGCGYGGVIEKIKKIDIDKLKPKLNLIEAAVLKHAEQAGTPKKIPEKSFHLWSYLADVGRTLGREGKKFVTGKYNKVKNYALTKYNRSKAYVRDKYDQLRNWKAKHYWRTRNKIVDKYTRGRAYLKDKLDQLRNWKAKTVSHIRWWGERQYDKVKKFTNKIRANSGQLYYLLKSLGNIAIEGIKNIGSTAFNCTRKMIVDLGEFMGRSGWNPYQIAMAINLFLNPITCWERLGTRGIEMLPGVFGLTGAASSSIAEMAKVTPPTPAATEKIVQEQKTTPTVTSSMLKAITLPASVPAISTDTIVNTAKSVAGLGYGGAILAAGYRRKGKKRGYLKKGSPEAKARMAYLRSLRRR